MSQLVKFLCCVALALLGVLTLREARAADPDPGATPRGPAFGTTRYHTELRTVGREADQDDYVASLVRGEGLSLSVVADRGSELRPDVTVLDPLGNDRTPPLLRPKGGRSVALKSLPIDLTGNWTVRVTGEGGTTGGYSVSLRVRGALRLNFGPESLDDGVVERLHEFDGADGARATIALRRRGAEVAVNSLAGPLGDPIPLGNPSKRRATETFRDVALSQGNGTYALNVALDEDAVARSATGALAKYRLSVALSFPERPKGRIELDGAEPRLIRIVEPMTGYGKGVLRLQGSGFQTNPLPAVYFSQKRATVLSVSNDQRFIDVVVPSGTDGTEVAVTVQNPDGQADTQPRYMRYVAPTKPSLDSLTPGTASVYLDETRRFTVHMDRAAPALGSLVTLSVASPIGTTPPTVLVAAGERTASFDFQASNLIGAGSVSAAFDGVTVTSTVRILKRPDNESDPDPAPAPDEIDIGGWALVQTNSVRVFSIPQGTRLKQGDYVVIGRTSSAAALESYWNLKFGANVHFLSGEFAPSSTGDDWPSINGDETFELRNAASVTVDGPTIAMQAGGGAAYARVPGAAAGNAGSWSKVNPTVGNPTPGSGQPSSSVKHGVYISEFADALGSGNFIYEFVELHFDGLTQ